MKRAFPILLALVACKKPAPAVDPPDAAPPRPEPAALVDAAIPVVVDASAPVTTREEMAPAALTLTLVASFSPSLQNIHGLRLADGLAIGQSNETAWNIYTVGPGKPLANLFPKAPHEGDPMWIWGTTDEVWASGTGAGSAHATRAGILGDETMLRFAVPFRGDQWIGVKSFYPPFYMTDQEPNTFIQLHAADKALEVPKVPKDIQLWALTSLGDGKLCGVGIQEGDAGANPFRMWTWSSPTSTRVIDLPAGSDISGGYARTFRAAGGDCMYVGGDKQLAVHRLVGNHIVPVVDGIPHGAFDVTNAGGALWSAESGAHTIHRFDLTKNPARETKYSSPASVEGCVLADVEAIAAIADDDLWVLAHCDSKSRGHAVLLHTEPAGAAVTKVAPPK